VKARRHLSVGVVVLGLLSTAATAGDVGGCGTEPTLLDRERYSEVRKLQDCDRCQECGLETERCRRACNPEGAPDIVLPPTCRPYLRDGEVCVRALAAASCTSFATYVDDFAPAVPSECDFCKVAPEPPAGNLVEAGPPGATGDAGR